MLYGLIIVIHVMACALLVGIVLIQAGRGGGLTDTFSSMESIFGTRTNTFLTRATAVLATLFIITCLSLTFIATKKSRSLVPERPRNAVGSAATGEAAQKPSENTATVQNMQPPEPKSNAAEIPAK